MAYIGTSPSNGVRRIHTYTATAGQTTFTGSSTEGVTLSYADTNYIDVFQNGVLLGSADYTSTSGTSVVLAQGASVSDLVVIVVYDVFSVADTVSKTAGGSFDSGVSVSGDLTVDTSTLKVDSSNNRVGVGTATPLKPLHIEGSSEADIFLRRTDLTNKAWLFNVQSSTGDLNIKSRNDDASASTTSMIIAHDGYVTMPLQPCFHAHKNTTDETNLGTNSTHTMQWAGERFDLGADFDLSNNQFVAPVTGKYFLSATARLEQVDTAAVYYLWTIVTSNQTYHSILDPNFSADTSLGPTLNLHIVADMDASDTAQVKLYQQDGTAQTDVDGDPQFTFFSGYLIA